MLRFFMIGVFAGLVNGCEINSMPYDDSKTFEYKCQTDDEIVTIRSCNLNNAVVSANKKECTLEVTNSTLKNIKISLFKTRIAINSVFDGIDCVDHEENAPASINVYFVGLQVLNIKCISFDVINIRNITLENANINDLMLDFRYGEYGTFDNLLLNGVHKIFKMFKNQFDPSQKAIINIRNTTVANYKDNLTSRFSRFIRLMLMFLNLFSFNFNFEVNFEDSKFYNTDLNAIFFKTSSLSLKNMVFEKCHFVLFVMGNGNFQAENLIFKDSTVDEWFVGDNIHIKGLTALNSKMPRKLPRKGKNVDFSDVMVNGKNL